MLDATGIARAEQELELRRAIQRAAEVRADVAERELKMRRANFAVMVEDAAGGAAVDPADAIAAKRGVEDAEAWAAFTATVARGTMPRIEAAERDLADARHQAWSAVARHGIELRIAAAAKLDRQVATLNASTWGASQIELAMVEGHKRKAVAEIEPVWQRGADFVSLAARSGWRVTVDRTAAVPQWPSTERAERQYWKTPASMAEGTADAA